MSTPAIGVRWEARRWLATLTTACLVTAMMMLYAGAALAGHVPPDDIVPQDAPGGSNEGPYWVSYLATERGITGATCTKINQASGSAFVMPSAPAGSTWVLLVVKQATDNFVYYDPVGGHSYPSTGDQAPGYSHLIVCSVIEEETTTTTIEDTTTTSVEDTTTTSVEDTTTTSVEDTTTTSVEDTTTTSVEDTTTTSVEDTTTTSVEDTTTTSVEDTTTTSVEDTTTTSVEDTTTTSLEDTTTTSVEDTTTTTEESTTTTDETEVLPTVVTTTPDEVDDEELPFTGLDSDVMFGIAVLLLGAGAALLAMTRRLGDDS